MDFQENKFPIILGAVTAVAVGGLIFWGIKGGSRYEAAKSEFDSAAGEIRDLTSRPIKPTNDNARAKKAAVDEYREQVIGLQEAFDPYRAPNPENIDPTAFVDALIAARDRLTGQFDENDVTLPDEFFLGLGRFSTQQPSRSQTGMLNYELGAFEDLFGRLAAAAPSELLNVHWAGLPESLDDEGGRNSEAPTFRSHSIEVTFRGSEAALREFLGSLDESDQYYFVVRSMRVKNERTSPPNADDATFAVSEATDSGAGDGGGFGDGGFVFPGEEDDAGDGEEDADDDGGEEDPAEEPAADTAEILKQVLGNEEIEVFLRIDVLQFLEPKDISQA